jgi:elongation factor G
VDLLSKKRIYEGDSGNLPKASSGDLKGAADEMRQKLMESVSETDDELLEKYLDGKEISTDELKKAIREQTRQGKLYPILYGSALKQIGIQQLLDAIIDIALPLDEDEKRHNPNRRG